MFRSRSHQTLEYPLGTLERPINLGEIGYLLEKPLLLP